MAITYNAGTNTITVTGYTGVTPCTFLDFFNADVAGGWGVVTKQCTNQFCFDCKVKIGDGAVVTWFGDISKAIVINAGVCANGQEWLYVAANSHFRSGEVLDATKKSSQYGCSLLSLETNAAVMMGIIGGAVGSDVQLYSSFVSSVATYPPNYLGGIGGGNRPWKIWHCLFDYTLIRDCWNVDMYGCSFTGFAAIIGLTGAIERVTAVGRDGHVLRFYQQSASMKDITLIDCNAVTFQGAYMGSSNGYLINVDNKDHAVWAPTWQGTNTGKIYRQYEFDLKVQNEDEDDINGATVKIWDKDDNLVTDVTTGADGKIVTQTLNYGFYKQSTGDTPTMQTPHIIEISKAGVETYTKKFTINKKIDWIIALHRPKHTSNRVFKVHGIPEVVQA